MRRVLPSVPGDPGIQRLGRVPRFWLQPYRVHNARYVSNPGVRFTALALKVYDAQTRKILRVPFLKRLAKGWYSARLVHYDPSRRTAGLWVVKRIAPSPQLTTHYTHVDLRSRGIRWQIKVGGQDLLPLGVDNAGRQLLAYRVIRRKRGRTYSQKVILMRLSFRLRRVDWTHTVKLPTRAGLGSSLLGSARLHASADLRKVFIREYDERTRSRPKGYLTSPPTRGVIVDVASSTQVTFSAPVTSYGTVFDTSSRHLYVTSHQLGWIYKIDTRTGKVVQSVNQGYGAFHLLLSKTGRYLYCVHLTGVNVFESATLKPVSSIPLGTLFPGHRKLLTVASVVTLTSGDFLMGILKKGRTGRSHTPSGAGFVHFRAQE